MKRIFISLCLFIFTQLCHGQQVISIGEKQKIFSTILNEERELWIHLPKSYFNSDIKKANYPVIYLLDAEINFSYLATMIDFLAKEPFAEIPECILLGITNTNRTKNFTPTKSWKINPNNPKEILFENSGGAAEFLSFIQIELKPFVNKNYRSNGFEIFAGHSFGGLAVLYSFQQNPGLFNAYIANDPSLWWDSSVLVRNFPKAGIVTKNPAFLFLSKSSDKSHNEEWSKEMKEALLKYQSLIKQENNKNIFYRNGYYAEDDHGTVAFPATYHALKFIFNGFKTDMKQLVQSPEILEESYNSFSAKVSHSFHPSETYLNIIINYAKRMKKENSAKIFEALKREIYGN